MSADPNADYDLALGFKHNPRKYIVQRELLMARYPGPTEVITYEELAKTLPYSQGYIQDQVNTALHTLKFYSQMNAQQRARAASLLDGLPDWILQIARARSYPHQHKPRKRPFRKNNV